MNITEIEAMNEQEVKNISLEHITIKGHDIYFTDIGGAFGYSAIVFLNGGALKYANDYQLHHPGKTQEELRNFYIRKYNAILFTEEELVSPLKDYDDYHARMKYIHNHYGCQNPHVSIFYYGDRPAEVQAVIDFGILNPVAFAYYEKQYEPFVKHHIELYEALQNRENEMKNSEEYWVGAFVHELWNHEFHINGQGHYDALSAFGHIEYHGDEPDEVSQYFKELNFTDVQKIAYMKAIKKFYKEVEAMECDE